MRSLTSFSAPGHAQRWLVLGASLGSSVLLLAGSATAFAAEDRGPRGEAEGHERIQWVLPTPGAARDNENDPDDSRQGAFNAPAVVNALNNQVTRLSTAAAAEIDDENDEDNDELPTTQRVAGVTTTSLATLVTRLSATDAATLIAAVNANTSGLQAFLNGGTPAANAIIAALNKANISPASVLAILPSGDGQLLVLLA